MSEATAFVLATRLFNLGALESLPSESWALTAAEAREAINAYQCEWAVCARAANKVLTFSAYFAAVYGVKLDGSKLRQKGAA